MCVSEVNNLPKTEGHTNDVCRIASTTALNTFPGSRSRVVPLSTMALSELYWTKWPKGEKDQSKTRSLHSYRCHIFYRNAVVTPLAAIKGTRLIYYTRFWARLCYVPLCNLGLNFGLQLQASRLPLDSTTLPGLACTKLNPCTRLAQLLPWSETQHKDIL